MTIDYEFTYLVLGKLVDRLLAWKGFERWMNGGTRRAKEILEEVEGKRVRPEKLSLKMLF